MAALPYRVHLLIQKGDKLGGNAKPYKKLCNLYTKR